MEFKKYRRTNVAEMRPVTENDINTFSEIGYLPAINNIKVSISMADLKNGSPKNGDMIARNPQNHNDMWLIAKDYFEGNFEPVD